MYLFISYSWSIFSCPHWQSTIHPFDEGHREKGSLYSTAWTWLYKNVLWIFYTHDCFTRKFGSVPMWAACYIEEVRECVMSNDDCFWTEILDWDINRQLLWIMMYRISSFFSSSSLNSVTIRTWIPYHDLYCKSVLWETCQVFWKSIKSGIVVDLLY